MPMPVVFSGSFSIDPNLIRSRPEEIIGRTHYQEIKALFDSNRDAINSLPDSVKFRYSGMAKQGWPGFCEDTLEFSLTTDLNEPYSEKFTSVVACKADTNMEPAIQSIQRLLQQALERATDLAQFFNAKDQFNL